MAYGAFSGDGPAPPVGAVSGVGPLPVAVERLVSQLFV
jgi:hypothetical protein